MWSLLIGAETPAQASTADLPSVTLWLGVPGEAGGVRRIAADGAAGQCWTAGQAIHCPATGPVTFRWGPGGDDWSLLGDVTLAPGTTGIAFLWASEGSRAAELERLRVGPVDAALVRELFVRTGDNPVPFPSRSLFDALLGLVDHPDAKVRKEVVDALVPFWRHTASDPFPPDAPPVVPDGLIGRLASDPSRAVRRVLASRLREARGDPTAEEAIDSLLSLSDDGGGVQRAAFASLSVQARRGEAPAQATWRAAVARVSEDGAAGRAAAGTLAALSRQLEPGPDVDPGLAVRLTLAAHPERAWAVWRAWARHVPFDAVLAERLLTQTFGFSGDLLRSWADDDATGLAALIRRWEPRPPHSDRWALCAAALDQHPDEGLRALFADTLSLDAGDPEPR